MILVVNASPSPDFEFPGVPYSPLESSPVLETGWRRGIDGSLEVSVSNIATGRAVASDIEFDRRDRPNEATSGRAP